MALNHAGDTSLLLAPEDVPPVREYSDSGRSPFLLTCDHYGRLIPRVLGDLGLPESELVRHIGTLYQRDKMLPPLLLEALRAEPDLVVGDNEPYAVSDETDYTIPVHAEARGLMNTGIEIRQDLISDQAGEKAWADRLARILGEIETELRSQRLI